MTDFTFKSKFLLLADDVNLNSFKERIHLILPFISKGCISINYKEFLSRYKNNLLYS